MEVTIHFIEGSATDKVTIDQVKAIHFEGGFAILRQGSEDLLAIPAHMIEEVNTSPDKTD